VKILVTGASGFIAQHLIDNFTNSHDIYGLSRRDSINDQVFNRIDADLLEKNFERKLPPDIECVIHLAQSGGYRDFPNSADDMFRVNVEATFRLLEWSRKNQIKHFIFSSTANVYSPSSEILVENSQIIPDSFYGATKLSAENIVRQYHQYFSVDILRLFTVYGPRQENMLFPQIIQRIKDEQIITLADGVGVYLTPVFVGDVVWIIEKILQAPLPKESRLLNICSGNVVSLAKIVKHIEAVLHKRAVLRFTDEEPRFFT